MDELKHYGVPGMKWGVKKSVYDSMSKDQRRLHKKQFRADVRSAMKRREGVRADIYADGRVNNYTVRGRKVDQAYAEAVMHKAMQKTMGRNTVAALAVTAISIAGGSWVQRKMQAAGYSGVI